MSIVSNQVAHWEESGYGALLYTPSVSRPPPLPLLPATIAPVCLWCSPFPGCPSSHHHPVNPSQHRIPNNSAARVATISPLSLPAPPPCRPAALPASLARSTPHSTPPRCPGWAARTTRSCCCSTTTSAPCWCSRVTRAAVRCLRWPAGSSGRDGEEWHTGLCWGREMGAWGWQGRCGWWCSGGMGGLISDVR